MQTVRTRIAPSPTGYPHIGTIYQVLFDYAFAKKQGGKFILRIEDTDRSRFVVGAENVIFESLQWFGLDADEDPVKGGPYGPYRQSERLAIYKKYAHELVEKGYAYYCFCTKQRLEAMRAAQIMEKRAPMYDRTCLKNSPDVVQQKLTAKVEHVVRMKIPESESIIVDDLIVGRVEFDSNTIDHQVIMKSDGFPTYHLAVVVDDHLMQISHIFRGKEWLSSTPKHILLYRYFGWEIPKHAHLPLILNTDGKGKLSKRQGTSSVEFYKNAGYLPEAVLNYLSNIIWNHPQGKELYDLADFIYQFDITHLNSQGARFDLQKLTWMNGEYIRKLDNTKLANKVFEFVERKYPLELINKLVPLAQVRMKTLGEFTFFIKQFVEKPFAKLNEQQKTLVGEFYKVFSSLPDWKIINLEKASKNFISSSSYVFKDSLMSLRLAVTGEKVGLPLFETLEILGKTEVLSRLKKCL